MNSEVVCANCGKEAPGGAKFCPECGLALSGEQIGKKNAGQILEKKQMN